MNIGSLITRHAQYRPQQVAVVFEGQRLTYRAFNQHLNQLAQAFLALGIQKGDKIATLLPNCLELLAIYWAVAKIGAVVVPLSPLLRGAGLARLLNDSDSVMVVTNNAFREHLDPLKAELPQVRHYWLTDASETGYQSYHELVAAADDSEPQGISVADDDPYNIIYSSGTTGLPKGIVHNHYIRAAYCTSFAAAYRITPESVVLHTGALVFNGAFLTLMPTFFTGATYILHPHFDAEALIDTVAREKVTHIKMVPSQIIALLHSPHFSPQALQSLEMIGSVGAPLHRRYKEELEQHLPGRFYELYGLTEGFVTILDKHDVPTKMDSVGCPPPFFEMRIVDDNGRDLPPHQVGEIVGRGPITMPGYYKRPDLTAEALKEGWLYSGDLGYRDEDGFLYLVDRKKDMLISGGINVYPKDLEEIIIRHPDVQEVAVFGVPDEKWGETPVAAVILKPAAHCTAEALCAWANERIEARFQRIHQVLIKSEFPRSAAGKTLKRTLREAYLEASPRNSKT